jgi:carbamoyltransferase
MKPAEHEYKVMGLAPYGEDGAGAQVKAVFAATLAVEGEAFAGTGGHLFHYRDRLEHFRFDAIARGVQAFTEDALAGWIANAMGRHSARHLRLAGDMAYNVKVNQRLCSLADVASFSVPAGAGGEGLAIGAAFLACAAAGTLPKALASPYVGPAEDERRIPALAKAAAAAQGYRLRPAGPAELAGLLADGEIVGRVAGRSEFGPRALGNRSLLADPRRLEGVQRLNACIKHRDFWMPFAPSIAREAAGDLVAAPASVEAGLMTTSFATLPAGRRALAAAVHPADFSCRAQIVDRQANPAYHALLLEMGRRTGTAAVLNTSFNLHGEPIVQSAEDALRILNLSDLRHLVLGDLLVSK